MANCATCGNKAGLGKKLCGDCSAKELERQQELEAQRAAKEQSQREAAELAAAERQRQEDEARHRRYEAFISERFAQLARVIDSGVTPYLYDSIVVDARSYYSESPNPNAWFNFETATSGLGQFTDTDQLQILGWSGWEVVGAIPMTFGSTLYNTVGGNTVNAAAFGGMVVGATLLLRLPLTTASLSESRDVIEERLAREFPG